MYLTTFPFFLFFENFKDGWPLYECRWHNIRLAEDRYLKTSRPSWEPGQALRVFLWGEQGIGDQIAFASFIDELHTQVSELIVHVDGRLVSLFKRSFSENIIFCPKGNTITEDEFDAHIPMGSIAQYFRPDIDSFQATSNGWLKADNNKIEVLRSATSVNAEILQMKNKIGIIKENAFADLIILNDNPLKNINVFSNPNQNVKFILKDGEIIKNILN